MGHDTINCIVIGEGWPLGQLCHDTVFVVTSGRLAEGMSRYDRLYHDSGAKVTHPHPLLAAGVPATPQKSPVVTSND